MKIMIITNMKGIFNKYDNDGDNHKYVTKILSYTRAMIITNIKEIF